MHALKLTACLLVLLVAAQCRAATTVAVAVSVADSQSQSAKKIAEALPPLLMLALGEQENLQVVERAELESITGELARGLANKKEEAVQVGQLDAADLLVGVVLSEATDDRSGYALARVTEGSTAVVRAIRAVPIDTTTLEEASSEIALLVASVTDKRANTRPMIAVLPFDSVEQFGRIVALERGFRDLLATELQRRGAVRVVQRSSMAQLLTELDLVRGGLTRGSQAPAEEPSRQSTYVVRGELDERIHAGHKSEVLIAAEIVDPVTNQVVHRFKTECPRAETMAAVLELASETERLALGEEASAHKAPTPAEAKAAADRLFRRAYTDVTRFIRYCPDDAGYLPFYLPGVPFGTRSYWGHADPDTETGRSALLKAIDRLESSLFIDPERLEASITLAYCLSFHVEGAWDPDRCEELIDVAYARTDDKRVKQTLFRLKADLYFPHVGQLYHEQAIKKLDATALQRVLVGYEKRLTIFEQAPESMRRNYDWVRLLRVIRAVADLQYEAPRYRRLLRTLAAEVESDAFASRSESIQAELRRQAIHTASQVSHDRKLSQAVIDRMPRDQLQQYERAYLVQLPAELREEALALLKRWSRGSDKKLAIAATEKLRKQKVITLEEQTRRVAELTARDEVDDDRLYQIAKIAARYRFEGQPQKGLDLLNQYAPPKDIQSGAYNAYGRALGRCYEALGKNNKALETYLHYLERSDSLYYQGPLLQNRVRDLGGPPLNADRDIDVSYLDGPGGRQLRHPQMQVVGNLLYLAGGRLWDRDLKRYRDLPCHVVSPADRTIQTLDGPEGGVRCIRIGGGFLWAGTRDEGLWRRDMTNGEWEHWTTEDGLPTNTILGIRLGGDQVIVTAAKLAGDNKPPESQGPVRVELLANGQAKFTPLKKVSPLPKKRQSARITRDQLVVRGVRDRVYKLNLRTGEWTDAPDGSDPQAEPATTRPIIDENPRSGGVWTSKYKGTPSVRFFAEHEGQLWLGFNGPLHGFAESGLYRIDLAQGSFHRYGLRDGFRYLDTHPNIDGGAVIDGSLWLLTGSGLAEIRPRGRLALTTAETRQATAGK